MGITSGSSIRLRLQRAGQRHKPFYRIVASRRRAPRDGKHFEVVGTYNPLPDRDGNKHVSLNTERIKLWLMRGAEPSERVAKLLGLAELCPPPPRRYVPSAVAEAVTSQGAGAATEDVVEALAEGVGAVDVGDASAGAEACDGDGSADGSGRATDT